jgi:DNA-binding NarL/FixJ family response regulator
MDAEAAPAVRVFLLDDHEVVRRGVAALLSAEPGIEVVGEAGTAAQALARVPALRPDVAVLDVRLPDGDGVQVCRSLRSRLPDLACLMLTSFADDDALFDAVMAGAAGYVLKQIHGTDLVEAVRTVAAGHSLLDPATTSRMLQQIRDRAARRDPLAILTQQERRILELIGEGLTNRQIGERIYLAEKTVKNYVSTILTKLDMRRRTQLAALSAQLKAEARQETGARPDTAGDRDGRRRDDPRRDGAVEGAGPHPARAVRRTARGAPRAARVRSRMARADGGSGGGDGSARGGSRHAAARLLDHRGHGAHRATGAGVRRGAGTLLRRSAAHRAGLARAPRRHRRPRLPRHGQQRRGARHGVRPQR